MWHLPRRERGRQGRPRGAAAAIFVIAGVYGTYCAAEQPNDGPPPIQQSRTVDHPGDVSATTPRCALTAEANHRAEVGPDGSELALAERLHLEAQRLRLTGALDAAAGCYAEAARAYEQRFAHASSADHGLALVLRIGETHYFSALRCDVGHPGSDSKQVGDSVWPQRSPAGDRLAHSRDCAALRVAIDWYARAEDLARRAVPGSAALEESILEAAESTMSAYQKILRARASLPTSHDMHLTAAALPRSLGELDRDLRRAITVTLPKRSPARPKPALDRDVLAWIQAVDRYLVASTGHGDDETRAEAALSAALLVLNDQLRRGEDEDVAGASAQSWSGPWSGRARLRRIVDTWQPTPPASTAAELLALSYIVSRDRSGLEKAEPWLGPLERAGWFPREQRLGQPRANLFRLETKLKTKALQLHAAARAETDPAAAARHHQDAMAAYRVAADEFFRARHEVIEPRLVTATVSLAAALYTQAGMYQEAHAALAAAEATLRDLHATPRSFDWPDASIRRLFALSERPSLRERRAWLRRQALELKLASAKVLAAGGDELAARRAYDQVARLDPTPSISAAQLTRQWRRAHTKRDWTADLTLTERVLLRSRSAPAEKEQAAALAWQMLVAARSAADLEVWWRALRIYGHRNHVEPETMAPGDRARSILTNWLQR